ncbi:MAG: FMN-binding glutamate synthase family protein [Bacteroidota bacterium]
MRNEFLAFTVIYLALIGGIAYFIWAPIQWILLHNGPSILLGLYDMFQTKHAIMRNFPILGRGRYVMEFLRPKIYQYFIESDTNGAPVNRSFRSIVYARAKQELDTHPFGTQLNVYNEGYEWMNHSIAALDPHEIDHDPRVTIGGPDCQQPYACSLLNVSAMSFGSLSSAAVRALNGGAKIGGFAHNTGEGGISPYHQEHDGDLIYQIGTGYFGCRTPEGQFSPELFRERGQSEQVKMIEIKLSQGAKPGHGGILPAKKNTLEISKIRNVEPFTDVLSPPFHRAFDNPVGLLKFVQQLRELSGGKPIGFKLCIGNKSEFLAIGKAMVDTGIKPDFIAIDGAEGGTGAAPLEFSNFVGMPFKEGLAFAYDALVGFDLKKDIKLIAAGKIFTGFHLFRALALGADACYSARAMMLALGCIQALECNKNTCPTGVATQNKELIAGLNVEDKKQRVANYHRETIESLVELLAASGLREPQLVNRGHIYRRINMQHISSFAEIYPYVQRGSLLQLDQCPEPLQAHWQQAHKDSFVPQQLHSV